MRPTLPTLLIAAMMSSGATLVSAQVQPSHVPHERTSATLAHAKITIDYGRPHMKGQAVFGGLVPWGRVWETGDDESTTLTTDSDLMIGKLRVPKGTYTVFTIPEKNEWVIIVNRAQKNWGALPYDAKMDVGRAKMRVERCASPFEQFTISLETKGDRQGVLKMMWDRSVASIPVMVP